MCVEDQLGFVWIGFPAIEQLDQIFQEKRMQTVINFIDNNGSSVFQCIFYDRAKNEDPFRAL